MGCESLVQTRRARLRSVARLRVTTRNPDLEPFADEPAAVRARSYPANELRGESLRVDRPVRPMGNLRRPADLRRLAVPLRRSGSISPESGRRPAAGTVRDLAGNS